MKRQTVERSFITRACKEDQPRRQFSLQSIGIQRVHSASKQGRRAGNGSPEHASKTSPDAATPEKSVRRLVPRPSPTWPPIPAAAGVRKALLSPGTDWNSLRWEPRGAPRTDCTDCTECTECPDLGGVPGKAMRTEEREGRALVRGWALMPRGPSGG